MADDPVMRHARLCRNAENRIEQFGIMRMRQRENPLGTCQSARFAKRTTVLLECQLRRTVLCDYDNLLITRSDTSFTLANYALVLKSRFAFAVRRSNQKRLSLFGLFKRFDERSEELSSIRHYSTPSFIVSIKLEEPSSFLSGTSGVKVLPTIGSTFACGA